MITCEQCGKNNGSRELGTSWICEDCKIGQVKRTLINSGGKVIRIKEKINGQEPEEDSLNNVDSQNNEDSQNNRNSFL